MNKLKKINIYSDFNLDLFYDFLENIIDKKRFNLINSEFNQIDQFLRKKEKKSNDEILFLWLSSNYFLKHFNNSNDKKKFENFLIEFTEIIKKKSTIYEYILIPSIVIDNIFRENNIFDFNRELSEKNLIEQINLKLKDSFVKYKNVFILDSNNWIFNLGEKSFNRKMWYNAKIPFSFEFLKYISGEIKLIINSIYEENKKLIILDLDNTLWGGILGDLGYDGINLGGHDAEGEAYQDFQRELLKLKKKGMILAISSKNNEKNVEEVFKKNNEMILKEKDFAIKKINWNDKANNIGDILKTLNLTPSSAIFFDDSKHERDRVKNVFRDMEVPDMPENPLEFVNFLLKQKNLNIKELTKEDKKKTKLYHDEARREKLKTKIKTKEEWLKELKINLVVHKLNKKNYQRVIQLLNKTNQFNLRTNRYSDADFKKTYTKNGSDMYAFEVIDKFGSAGIISAVGILKKNKSYLINDFVMSCRVFGRDIEMGILHVLSKFKKKDNYSKIEFNLKKTKKNLPTVDFLHKANMKNKNNKFIWDRSSDYFKPKHLKINYKF